FQGIELFHARNVAEGVIAGKKLVAALAGKRHLQTGASHSAGDDEGIKAVHARLIHGGEGIRDAGEEFFSSKSDLLMFGFELARNQERELAFAVVAFLEYNGESVDLLLARTRHSRHKSAGINATGKEQPDRNVTDHAQVDGFSQQFLQAGHRTRFADSVVAVRGGLR